MTQHTQGPWIIMPRENLPPRIKSKSFGIICKLNDIFPTENGYQENEANARLIAAAPELLAALIACEKLLTDLEKGGANNPELALAQSAIAKAKGI